MNKINSKFSERLDELMFEKNITHKDIQKALNVDLSIVYSWLSDLYVPTFNNIVTLAEFFNCSLDFLAGLSHDTKLDCIYKKTPNFGQQLRSILKKESISIYRICKDLKISTRSVYDWLNNVSLPYLDSLVKLVDYIDCTLDYLVGRI